MSLPTITASKAFARYEKVRPRLPTGRFPVASRSIDHLEELVDEIDVFLLDAFGVLNIGEQAIPGAVQRIENLRRAGKTIFILTNSATFSAEKALQKYREFGFDFSLDEIISSRDVALSAIAEYPVEYIWGVAATPYSQLQDIAGRTLLLEDDPADYASVNGFLFLSTAEWTLHRQELLLQSLADNPRPLLVGNPDLVAPREQGLSLEPGFFAHEIADATGIEPDFFGKPFSRVFQRALATINGNDIPTSRIAMVGDTLHTDILGGAAAGLKTVLVTDHGLFKSEDVVALIRSSGIVPDYIARTT